MYVHKNIICLSISTIFLLLMFLMCVWYFIFSPLEFIVCLLMDQYIFFARGNLKKLTGKKRKRERRKRERGCQFQFYNSKHNSWGKRRWKKWEGKRMCSIHSLYVYRWDFDCPRNKLGLRRFLPGRGKTRNRKRN